jgi:hypothetical protein
MSRMKVLLTLGLMTAMCSPPVAAQAPTATFDRTVLPIQEPKRPVYTELDARNVKTPPHFEGRIEHTRPAIFSTDETADVGIDLGTPVVEAIGSEARSRFSQAAGGADYSGAPLRDMNTAVVLGLRVYARF